MAKTRRRGKTPTDEAPKVEEQPKAEEKLEEPKKAPEVKPKKPSETPDEKEKRLRAEELEAALKLRAEKQGQPGYRKPQPHDILVSARQFVRLRRYRWERCAGFLHEMRQNHGPMAKKTRPEWDVLWEAYRKRPIK